MHSSTSQTSYSSIKKQDTLKIIWASSDSIDEMNDIKEHLIWICAL